MEKNIRAPHVITIPVTPCTHSRLTTTESGVHRAVNKVVTMDESVEAKVLSVLLSVEKKYRYIFATFKKEMELQRIAASTLWGLIQRYRIAMEMDANCKCTQLYAVEPKEEIIQKYFIHYQVIISSNKSQWWGIESMRSYVLTFRRECSKLNLEEETPFILGDAFHKPITFFMDLVDELFNYFFSLHLKLDCAAGQLDPMDLESLEYYQKLLQTNEDFEEYFMYNLSYCQCLRMPPKCPETRVYTNIDNSAVKKEAMEQAKRARCNQRVSRMTARASQIRGSKEKPVPVSVPSQVAEVSPPDVVPHMAGKLLSIPLSSQFEEQLMSERHTRMLVHQVQKALSQS
ncbi:uncharacterized protein LOC111079302 [Drosophila obscura]|uniref:uncharacterized protein LOC111079302 n=1 Tax=Drosophila obscura TaxID=7282 RepID=UPI001BB1505A|nr:uncharacterized protein LOC111079302 [Drosophila obscura]